MFATSHLFRSGSSFHVTIPKPLREHLKWNHREELLVQVMPDATLRVMTVEQWATEREARAIHDYLIANRGAAV